MLKESLDEAIRGDDSIVQKADVGRRKKVASIKADYRLLAGDERSLIYLP